MGIRVVWDNPQRTIVRYIYDEKWTWDDFFRAKAEAVALIDTVNHKVGVIMDSPPNVQLPPNMLTHSKSALQNKHPNTTIVVFVTVRPFLRTMINTLVKLTKGQHASIYLVANVDEAREIIGNRLQTGQESTLTKRYRELNPRQ